MKKLFFALLFAAPLMAAAQILSPQVDSIPTRDGKQLAVDIYTPSGAGPWPVILIQTPYNRQVYRWTGLPLFGYDVSNMDYAVVVMDWRGFYGSFGAIGGTSNRGEDGYDAVQWVAAQSFCDGKVGTWGPSALGGVQYQTARENPPNLVCCAPLVAGMQTKYQNYYPGGALRIEYLNTLDMLGYGVGGIVKAHPEYDIYWQFAESGSWYPEDINVPMFMIGGWYDHNVNDMIELFLALQSSSGASVRDAHKMLFGPWVHGGTGPAYVGSEVQGELSYPGAAGWSDSLALRFFDYYLRNQSNGWSAEPVFRYFQMGEDVWNFTNGEWPPVDKVDSAWYLHPASQLFANLPSVALDSASVTCDPRDPSPTVGGPTLTDSLGQGPYDQAPLVESRADVLTFSTPTLSQPLEIRGEPRLIIHVSADRYDTDVAVRLTDYYPDGRSMLIMDGIQRLRYLNGYTSGDSIVPGQIYEVEVSLQHTAITIESGHRLRLDIGGANYPRYAVNPNSGQELNVPGDTFTVVNTFYWGTDYPSRLILPVSQGLVSAEQPQVAAGLRAWPNPSRESCMLSYTSNGRPGHLRLIDLSGRILREWEFAGTAGEVRRKIEYPGLSGGIYLLTLEQEGVAPESIRLAVGAF